MLEKIGYSYRDMMASGYVWPIIDTRVKYVKSIPYDHKIRVEATLTEWETACVLIMLFMMQKPTYE